MKKILLGLLFAFFLVGCSSTKSIKIEKEVGLLKQIQAFNHGIDPTFAPGTGTPEIAGMTTREMVNVLRGLSGLNLISADVVEVAPAYDHAEVTSLAAATIIYELTNLFAKISR